MIQIDVAMKCDGPHCRAVRAFACRPPELQEKFEDMIDEGWTIRANKCFCVECTGLEVEKARDARLLNESPADRDRRLLREEGER